MDYRHHLKKVTDYSIRVALISIVVVPIWVFLSIGPGLGTEPSDSLTDRFGFSLFIFFAPGYYSVKFLHVIGIHIGIIDWLVICGAIPVFWGILLYGLVQFCRQGWMLGHRLTKRSG